MKKKIKIIFMCILLALVIGLLGGTYYVTKTLETTPVITEEMLKAATGGTTHMYDKDGNIIYSDTDRRRDYIKIEDTPQLYINMLLATEDKDYYKENGYSVKGILNAIKGNVFKLGEARGGSTIEQQLIKNLVFSSSSKDRTIDRKIKEIWLAAQMDKNFTKDQILEWYINLIFLGENSYGANTISLTYYGIPLNELTDESPETISKLAIIAGLGQAPTLYNLYDNPTETQKRRDTILYIARQNNLISEELYKQALLVDVKDGLKDRYWRNTDVINSVKEHSAFVSSALKQVEELGYDLSKTPMQIYTTLDSNFDSNVKSIIENYNGWQSNKQQFAATIIDPTTNYVIAQYGGRNTEPFGLNRAIQTTRSTGSSTKPFISYGPAIEYFGYGSNSLLDSSNYVYPGTNIVARNYGGYLYGTVTMERAVQMSMNTPAIRILDNVTGSANTKEFLSNLNLDVKDTYGGQDALGLPLSTEQVANAMSTLANLGEYSKPQYIKSIKFNDDSVKEIQFNKTRAMKESTAFILLKMLETVPTTNGTGTDAIISQFKGYAVKTGTVGYDASFGYGDLASDTWTIGTTKSASIAVWTGYDSPNERGNQIRHQENLDQKIFKQLMLYANQNKDTSDWSKPSTVNQIGNYYKPTDTNTTTKLTYTIPEITVSSDISKPNNDYSIKDDGMSDTYSKQADFDTVVNWKTAEDSSYLSYWVSGYTPLETLRRLENIFVVSTQ